MNNLFDTRKKENENEYQYLWRLGQAKDSGIIDMDWNDIAQLMNSEFVSNGKPYSEAAWRKPYQMAKKFFEHGVFNHLDKDKYFKELQIQKDEIYKEKRKLYDQRREYNKLLTHDARAEHLNDELITIADKMNSEYPLIEYSSGEDTNSNYNDKEALLVFSDWHYGMITDNIWNQYNVSICKERIRKVIDKSKEYLKLNHIQTLHVALLGDAAHGGCHVTCRVKSEEDVCDQIIHVSELMAESINELSSYVGKIIVHSCYGNHLRTIQNKQDSVDSDNLEKIIPWWIKERLKLNNKIKIEESEYKEFTRIDICGYHVCCVHGNLDNFKNLGMTVNTLFSKKFGETIDYTISGDKHHLEEFESYGIESILIRSLCGTDDYANERRLYSNPGQTLIIFNTDDGREATYHIKLK